MATPNTSAQREHLLPLDTDAPLSAQLLDALKYPLRSAALPSVILLALAQAISGIFPSIIDWALSAFLWISIYMYALECLRHTANGYARPPQIKLYSGNAPGITLYLIQLVGLFAIVVAQHLDAQLWLVAIGLAVLLPAITMSLAFEDSVLSALNPRTLVLGIYALRGTYLLPLALGGMQYLIYIDVLRHHANFPLRTLSYLLVVYLVTLNFHVMGRLVHRFRDRMGLEPDIDQLARITGRDADAELVADAQNLVQSGDIDRGLDMLSERLHKHSAPQHVHMAYRELLRKHARHADLLAHAQTWIATLMLDDDLPRALGVVQECLELDPDFLPDSPDITGELADAAARKGMSRMALKLARGYPNTWPRAEGAPRYGLLAAQLLAGPLHQRVEAGVLAAKLLDAYPHSEQRADIEALLQTLGMRGHSGQSA